jgi:ribonuclease D
VSYRIITRNADLERWCQAHTGAPRLAYDTEFVSEHTYRPVLCLVQVAVPGEVAVIDPLSCDDLSPFWEWVAAPGHETVVHAGREEVLFCLGATGRQPHQLLDVQIAAGLVGAEYPAGYSNLLSRILGITAHKHETRTDWRKRPLSRQQLDYAADDVRHLLPLWDEVASRLERLDRMAWLISEMSDWRRDLDVSRGEDRWRRVVGGSLSRRGLSIVQAIWTWREERALRRNLPPRRILRDDLILELARRGTADVRRIRALRGLERGDLRESIPEVAGRIAEALALPESECPEFPVVVNLPPMSVTVQFIGAALASLCRRAQIAPSLMGTASDVRDFLADRLKLAKLPQPPQLASGWRGKVIGSTLDDLLTGRLSLRLAHPASEDPLEFAATG